MKIIEKIKIAQLEARKNRDKFTANILTCLYSEVSIIGKNAGNRDTTDEECLKCIAKFKKGTEEVYKLKPSVNVGLELDIYDAYLPKLMTEQELSKLISDMIDALPNPNIGMIMGQLKKSGYDYDGKMASTLIRDRLK